MSHGLCIDRQWVLVLPGGEIVVDWGDDRFQDVREGSFLETDGLAGAIVAPDAQLESLKQAGIISAYDKHLVYFTYLPHQPRGR
ncbi:MAG: hypothetical protein GYA48_08735 [Chloroflexi bacterium]|nr:hypothetical protein [Chloroflexota bacterium]